jgi:hypothetical protein
MTGPSYPGYGEQPPQYQPPQPPPPGSPEPGYQAPPAQYQPPAQYPPQYQPQYQPPAQYPPPTQYQPPAPDQQPHYQQPSSSTVEQPNYQVPAQQQGPAQAYGQQPGPYGQPSGPLAGYTPGTVGRINPGLRVGVVGSVLVLLGGILLVVANTALTWLSGDDGSGGTLSLKFSDIHKVFNVAGADGSQPARAYFGWLAWVLLVAVVLIGLLANAPMGLSALLRPLGLVLGLAGAGLTFWALKFDSSVSIGDELKHTSVGFWIAVAGFVLAGVGALLGPRHVRV